MSRDLSSRIFVGGLDHGVNEADLEKAFKIFGTITNVVVLRDKETGHSRGFAFVSYIDSQSSEDAIRRMHGVEIKGRCVTVRHAEKAKYFDDRPRRGGIRGGGRGGFSERGRSDTHSAGGSNGFTGGQRGRGAFRNESRPSYSGGRDVGYTRTESGNFGARSRSPLGATSTSYRSDSPPRRRIVDRGYSPTSRRDDYSPPAPLGRMAGGDYFQGGPSRVTDYYSTSRDFTSGSSRVQLERSPPPEDYGRYGSMQTLSPARERDAYINARARDYSPIRRQAYGSPKSASTRNQESPLERSASRQERFRDYGGATSRQYGSGSYSTSQDSAYGSRTGSAQQGLGSLRYGSISDSPYGSSLTRGGRKEASPIGSRAIDGQTGRIAAGSARDDSPPRRRMPSPRGGRPSPGGRQRRSPVGRRGDSPPKRRRLSPPRRQTLDINRGRALSPGDRRGVSPIARRSGEVGGRGPSPIGRRGPSPMGRNEPSSVRRRGLSPMRKNDGSPMNRRGSSPLGRRGPAPMSRRGPSPMNRRGPSPTNRRSASPLHKRGPSPMTRRGLSPPRKRGPSPMRKRGPSPMRRPGVNTMNKSMPSPMNRRAPSPTSRRMPPPMGRRPVSPMGRQAPDRRY